MENKKKREPLLYIDQPILEIPEAWMQRQYQGSSTKTIPEQKEGRSKLDVSFKKLSIAGQINYLLSGPKEVPAIRCEIMTKERKYRGMLIDQNDEEIIVRMIGRSNHFIPKGEILNIRLIGF